MVEDGGGSFSGGFAMLPLGSILVRRFYPQVYDVVEILAELEHMAKARASSLEIERTTL
jgi:hypothetical protein